MGSASVVYHSFGKTTACGDCGQFNKCVGRELRGEALQGVAGIEVGSRLYRRGDHVFRTGDPLEALYVVKSGAIKTYVVTSDGDEQVIGFHMPGDIAGLDAVAEDVHACAAVALDTSCVCLVSFDALSALSSRSAGVQRRLLTWMSREIRRDENMVLMLAKLNAEERMAAFLVEQAAHQRQRGFSGSEFTLAMSRADVGNYLGLAVETVSRVLTRFQSAGVLAVHRNRILIHHPEALQGYAEGTAVESTANRGALRATY